jgi:ferredoxin
VSEESKPDLHYVCTHAEAAELIAGAEEFYIGDCGCRKDRGRCNRSRMDICLEFRIQTAAEGSGRRRASRTEAGELLRIAGESQLVTRPFRDDATRTVTEGICFCCDCCCGYFNSGDGGDFTCEKGRFVERTEMDDCTHCGACVGVCYFNSRVMNDGSLMVKRDECYGCGLCVDACPVGCVGMEERV